MSIKVISIINKNMNEVLLKLLQDNANQPQTKELVKITTTIRQKLAYHAIMSEPSTYLQAIGISYHKHDEFNYIGQLLHSKNTAVLARIKRDQIKLNENRANIVVKQIKQKKKAQQALTAEIEAEIQQVLNNIDLPLSLFKRKDNYWYHDNPKTIQAKQFIKSVHKDDLEYYNKIKNKRDKILKEKQHKISQAKLAEQKRQQQQKQLFKEQMKMKIQMIKSNAKQRKQSIAQSDEFSNALKPKYRQIQKKFKQTYQIPLLEERKRKLSQIRSIHRSVDINQIKEHQKKLDELKSKHEYSTIKNQPLKVGYKSKFHDSLSSSMARQYSLDQSSVRSLYQRKIQYGTKIKQQHKPTIDENLVKQMQERLKLMKKRRVRAIKKPKQKKKKKKIRSDGESDEEDSEQQQQQQQQQQEEQQQNQEEDDQQQEDDSEDENGQRKMPKKKKRKKLPPRIRGEDEDPNRQQRYELGVDYLEYVRNLPKKKKQNQSKTIINEETDPKISKFRYRDYLQQMKKTSRTVEIDKIQTQALDKQLNLRSSLTQQVERDKSLSNIELQRKMRRVYEKAIQQEKLLSIQQQNRQEKVKKTYDIDSAVVATIKARLALMK